MALGDRIRRNIKTVSKEERDRLRDAVAEAKKKGLSDEAIFQATEAGKAELAGEVLILGRAL